MACPQLLEDDFQRLRTEPLGDAGVNVDSSGAGAGGHGGAGGAAGTGGAAGSGGVVNPPVLLSSIPADGASGVAPDIQLQLTFSAPMDTASVRAAYSSSTLPAEQMSFTWSAGDTVLHIVPSAELEVASGSATDGVVARQYALDLTAQARDKAGNALAPVHVGFSVVRSLTQALGVVQDRDLTGNWRTDGTYGLAFCERMDTTFCMGDTPVVGDVGYRGFLTFDLSALPQDVISLSSAELSAVVEQKFGSPFADLGELRSEHVSFDIIGDEAFGAAALAAPRTWATAGDVGSRFALEVLDQVQADHATRSRSQFRLSFESNSDGDAAADQLVFDWTSAQLTVTYLVP